MNSKNQVRPLARVSLLLLGAGLCVVLPLRLYQLMARMEQNTGFYSDASHWSVPLLYSVLAVLCAAGLTLGFLAKDVPREDILKGKQPWLAAGGFLLAAGLFSDFILRLIDAFNLFTSGSGTWEMSQISSKAGGALFFVQSALALAACFYCIIYASSRMGRAIDYRNFPLLAITPALWLVLRLVMRFLQPMNYRNVSEMMLEMFYLVTMLLFFWYFARVSSNVGGEGRLSRCYAFGVPAALFALTCGVPRLVLLVTGMKRFLITGFPVPWCDLAAGVFVLIFLFTGLRQAKEQNFV